MFNSLFLFESNLDKLAHFSLAENPVVILVELYKQLIELALVIILRFILLYDLRHLLNEFFGLVFAQRSYLLLVNFTPDLLQRPGEFALVIFQKVRECVLVSLQNAHSLLARGWSRYRRKLGLIH